MASNAASSSPDGASSRITWTGSCLYHSSFLQLFLRTIKHWWAKKTKLQQSIFLTTTLGVFLAPCLSLSLDSHVCLAPLSSNISQRSLFKPTAQNETSCIGETFCCLRGIASTSISRLTTRAFLILASSWKPLETPLGLAFAPTRYSKTSLDHGSYHDTQWGNNINMSWEDLSQIPVSAATATRQWLQRSAAWATNLTTAVAIDNDWVAAIIRAWVRRTGTVTNYVG